MSDIAVLICLNYGGLPLAREAIRSGPRVIGLDPNEMVAGLEPGRSNIDNVTDNDVMKMKCCRFCTIADPNVIALARAVVTCVPTPLSEDGCPGGRFRQTPPNVRKTQGRCQTGTTKPLENTSQQINIALVNKLARSSRDLNIDLWEVIGAASTPTLPIPIIPDRPQLSFPQCARTVGLSLPRVEPAEEINTSMPAHLARRVQGSAEQTARQFAVRVANADTYLLLQTTRRMSWTISPIMPALGRPLHVTDPHQRCRTGRPGDNTA
jgi:UDP-N-acetyl-D-mannosaminuronate dehydrogenase